MDNSYKQKKDWEEKFDEEFVEDLGDDVEPVWKDPVSCVGPVKYFIRCLLDETEKQAYEKSLLDRNPEIHLKKLTISQEVDMPDDVREHIRQQAQSEMREDLENKITEMWNKSYISEQSRNDLINYLNKTK